VEDKIERIEIDRAMRGPVLLFYGAAIAWLLIGSLLALIASLKFNLPSFLADLGPMTFGRVRPAHLNAVIYGWAVQAGIGTGLWLMARLCRVAVRHGGILYVAWALYNFGVTLGVLGILSGAGTSVEWLEFPRWASLVLFIAFALIAIWSVIMFRFRKPGHVYVSQWYILAAFFWFPWLYATANLIIFYLPVQAAVQGPVNWWYGHNVLGLFFTPLGLGAAYYLIPKVIGRPVHSYYLSILGFWSLAFFYSWNGMHHLIGGPFPAWLISASIAASFMMVVPVVVVGINHHFTMKGHFGALRWSPTLRFTVFGAVCYTLTSFQGTSMAIRSWNQITHFTHYTIGHSHLGMYGFFTMVMFGAMYYIVPRLVEWEWPSANMIRWHFWLCAVGICFMFSSLSVAGLVQGFALNDPSIPFLASTNYTKAFLWMRSVAGLMMTAGHVVFAASFALILLRAGQRHERPTLFGQPDEAAA
jgi:cytochrome c oxidase cbb3-type subunit I